MWNTKPSLSDYMQDMKEVPETNVCNSHSSVQQLKQQQQQSDSKEPTSTFGQQHQKEVADENKKCSAETEATTDSGFISGLQSSSSAILDTDNEPTGNPSGDIKKLNTSKPFEYNKTNEPKIALPHTVESGITDLFSNLSLQNNANENTTSSLSATGSCLNNLDGPKQEQSSLYATDSSNQHNKTAIIPQQITPAWKTYYQQNDDGDTSLHLACISGYVDAVNALIRMAPHPCLFNIQNDEAQTPLHLAALTGQPRIIRMLLLAGAKSTARDRHGNTALHLACMSGDIECVRALTTPISASEVNEIYRQYGQRVNDKSYLRYAQLPSDLEIRNYDGERCVHLAAQAGFINILRILVLYGADINAREGRSGRTPLHIAIECCNKKLANFLLDKCDKLNLETATYAGLTAYQVAYVLNKADMQNILEKRGAEPLTPPDSDCDSSDIETDLDDSKLYHRFGDPVDFVGYKGENPMTVA